MGEGPLVDGERHSVVPVHTDRSGTRPTLVSPVPTIPGT